ncbi:hypothetical protein HOD83_01765 [Candidatus Woesearchaeota archaeon]|jgi:hypothetical protein|nr:hypothetical protein [Candidatus Woesearchaeota archaeon]MBT4114432.1 hypothetical protein [Candidatus Woesearchaeota archaeon]MBT4248295.1 hypothetical protein [Candidatus Woesearchaeota archaeon]
MITIGLVAQGDIVRRLTRLLEVREDQEYLVQPFRLHGDALSHIDKVKRGKNGARLDVILSHEAMNKVPFGDIPAVYANQNCAIPVIHVFDRETETDLPHVTSDVIASELYRVIDQVVANITPECQSPSDESVLHTS